MDYRYTFYSVLQGFSRKRRYCNEMEGSLEASLTACRDNDHGTVVITSQAVSEVIESTKPKSTQGFQINREQI